MQNTDESKLLECPYDSSHRIRKTRMQVHLMKCRQNHKNVVKVTCPFNATHILDKPELDWHVASCPERQLFENFKYQLEPVPQTTPAPPPIKQTYDESESWDNEPDVPSYNAKEYANKAPVLRQIQGAPPSVRKAFRKQERLRLLGIENNSIE